MPKLGLVFRETMLATKRIVEHPSDAHFPAQCEAVAKPLGILEGANWYETDKAGIHTFWCCVLFMRWPDMPLLHWTSPERYNDVELWARTCHKQYLLASKQLANGRELENLRAFTPALFKISKELIRQWGIPEDEPPPPAQTHEGRPIGRAALPRGWDLYINPRIR